MRWNLQSGFRGFFREQARGDHHRRIARVRARRDRREHDRAVSNWTLEIGKWRLDAHLLAEIAFGQTVAAFHHRLRQRLVQARFQIAQCHALFRFFRTGETRLDRCEIKFERVVERRVWRSVGAEQSLLLRVPFEQIRGLAPGAP